MKLKDLIKKLQELEKDYSNVWVHTVDDKGEMLYDSVCNVRVDVIKGEDNTTEVILLES